MITKWILNNVRAVRPLRVWFLTTDEIGRLMDQGNLTYAEAKFIGNALAYVNAAANGS